MTRVDFYVSTNQAVDADLQLACRITEKAYRQKNRVYIHTNNAQQASRIDELLWTFREVSFVPHISVTGPVNEEKQAQTAVIIGCADIPEMAPDVLINLSDDIPNFFTRFERVAEIVSGPESARKMARSHFKFYRERGYPLETHELNS